MRRATSNALRFDETHLGHCVICDTVGTSEHDFICSECGDPLAITLYCSRCQRRLALNPDVAREFLAEHGYEFERLDGLVVKVDRCGTCMDEDDTVDLAIFRIRLG